MDIVTLGAALNGSAEYVNSHFIGGSNIQIVDNPDGTQTINASGEVSSEDTVARAEIAEMKDGTTIDSFGDVETALTGKVDTESGKGLSENDFTDALKTKLDGIESGAEVNVQSDWTQTTDTADDYIKNKPTLGTAAAKNATDTYNATGDDVTTGKAVAAALATLPEPMIFKGSLGTGGTITTLPTASSSNKGYVYKVITAGTYASQSAKVGDTFISDGATWVLIPSGDEPSGTVTNVAVANGGGLTVSGSPITSSGTITVGHSNSVTAKTSSSLKKFTYDAYGHVTDSSELSTAESDVLASGIDSTKVAQIETNKNNISYNANNGVKNIFNPKSTIEGDDTVSVTRNSDGTITLSTSSPTTRTAYIYLNDRPNFIVPAGTWTLSGSVAGYNSTQLAIYNNSTWASSNGVPSTITFNSLSDERLIIRIGSGVSLNNVTLKPMVCRADLYNADPTYQPHAMSNAELTAAIQALQAQLANQ